MKKKDFFTGSVFQFYVPEIKKHAFCKFFDFRHISEFHGLMAQVFDNFSDTENNKLEDLKNSDWLFGPKSLHKWPNLRKHTKWKHLGILFAAEDDIIPDFKDVQAFPYVVEDESKIGPWYPIHKLTQRGKDCEYKQVKHLEQLVLINTLGLEYRTGMEYCRINKLKVRDFYDLNNTAILSSYKQMINVPIYKKIPKKIRGKAIT